MADQVTNRSTISQLKPLVKTPQFYWFLGHFFAIIFFISYTLSSFFTKSIWLYNYSLNAIILTYLIVLRQSYSKRSFINLFSNYGVLLRDDNVQYLLLLLIFRFSSKYPGPVSSGLYPFIIFAVFHSLTYIKSFILPNLSFVNNELKKNYINLINNFVTQYNEKSLYLSSSFEFYLLVPVTISFLKLVLLFEWIRSTPIRTLKKLVVNISIIIFIKLRYNQSKHMKQIVTNYDLRINQLLYSNPYVPAQVQQLYQIVRQTIITYVEPIKVPQAPNIRKE